MIKAEKAPRLRQSSLVFGLMKLNVKEIIITKFMITKGQKPDYADYTPWVL